MTDIEENNDEVYTEPTAKFSTIGNLEKAKRCFFNNEFDGFVSDVNTKPYKFFKTIYKYSSDYDGRPEFIARNLNGGFSKDLEDLRKYFMCVFRCNKVGDKVYQYSGHWIVNTNDELSKMLGSRFEDFEWIEVNTDDDKNTFLNEFKKSPEDSETVISEEYVH